MQQTAFQQNQPGNKSRNISIDALGRDSKTEATDRLTGIYHAHSLTVKQPIQLASKVNITRLTQTLANKDQKDDSKKNGRHVRTQMLKPEDIRLAANARVELFFDEDLV